MWCSTSIVTSAELADVDIDALLVANCIIQRHTLPLVINCIRSFSRGAVAVLLRAPAIETCYAASMGM
jgi:hypothetical protein